MEEKHIKIETIVSISIVGLILAILLAIKPIPSKDSNKSKEYNLYNIVKEEMSSEYGIECSKINTTMIHNSYGDKAGLYMYTFNIKTNDDREVIAEYSDYEDISKSTIHKLELLKDKYD